MSVLAANSHVLCSRQVHHSHRDQQPQFWSNGGGLLLLPKASRLGFMDRNRDGNKTLKRDLKVEAFWDTDTSSPTVVELEAINDCDQLDQILSHAQESSRPVVIDWMASWCRKCIYLKPKLEKLAAEYDTKVKFYYVDVNKVPQALVKRGNISKMPTIQVWKDGEYKAEVIGGHKAWLVLEEVRNAQKLCESSVSFINPFTCNMFSSQYIMKEESVQSNLLSLLFLQMFVRMNSSFELNFSFLGASKELIILHSRWNAQGANIGLISC